MKNVNVQIYHFIVLFFALPVNAENCIAFPSDNNNSTLTFCVGTDMSLVTLTLGYTHSFSIPDIKRNLILNSALSIPLLRPDFKDFILNTGLKIDVLKTTAAASVVFNLPVFFTIIFRSHSNAAYNAMGFGTELGIHPGFCWNKKIALAVEIVWDAQIATHVSFSDYYKQTIYKDAVQGWYGFTSNKFRLGGSFGGIIGERYEVFLRGGYEHHGKYNLKIPPFYAVLGNNLRF